MHGHLNVKLVAKIKQKNFRMCSRVTFQKLVRFVWKRELRFWHRHDISCFPFNSFFFLNSHFFGIFCASHWYRQTKGSYRLFIIFLLSTVAEPVILLYMNVIFLCKQNFIVLNSKRLTFHNQSRKPNFHRVWKIYNCFSAKFTFREGHE